MPLDYAEFAHHYEGHGLSDDQKRVYFDTFESVMECIARFYWEDDASANRLGISLDGVSLAPSGTVESDHAIAIAFNGAAATEAAGKKES